MPVLLTSADEFQSSLLGQRLLPYYVDLTPGTLDRVLMQASARAVAIARRRLTAHPVTTLTAPSSPTSLTLANAINIRPGDVLTLGGETVVVASAQLLTPTLPDSNGAYVGAVTLQAPLTGTYSVGTTVTGYHQEWVSMRGVSSSAENTSLTNIMSQAGQIAAMHAPGGGRGKQSSTVFLRQAPVTRLLAAWQTLPWGNTESAVDLSSVTLHPTGAFFRLPVGAFNPAGSQWRIQYAAGYPFTAIPDDIQQATTLLAALELVPRAQNQLGVTDYTSGGERWLNTGAQYLADATALLEPYRWKWR